MRILSGDDLAALADPPALIPAIEAAMRAVARRQAELPLRTVMPLGGGNALGIMPGVLADPPSYGAKLLSLFPDNPRHGRSSHAGMMILFDAETGLPRACMDAAHLTAMRTAAASAVATRALAREDASVLAIIGTGEQAHSHLAAIQAVRELRRILIWGRDLAKAESFCATHPGVEIARSIEDALAAADIACTVTAARRPIVTAAMLHPGLHLNAVGASVPTMQEIAPECLSLAALFTDFRPSAEAQAGELREARQRGLVAAETAPIEIGAVLDGTAPGRADDDAITIYRSLGVAAQDLAAAHLLLELAEREGRGIVAPL
jgi:alanine dehydrogenase